MDDGFFVTHKISRRAIAEARSKAQQYNGTLLGCTFDRMKTRLSLKSSMHNLLEQRAAAAYFASNKKVRHTLVKDNLAANHGLRDLFVHGLSQSNLTQGQAARSDFGKRQRALFKTTNLYTSGNFSRNVGVADQDVPWEIERRFQRVRNRKSSEYQKQMECRKRQNLEIGLRKDHVASTCYASDNNGCGILETAESIDRSKESMNRNAMISAEVGRMNARHALTGGGKRSMYQRRLDRLKDEKMMEKWWPLSKDKDHAAASLRLYERRLREMRDAKFEAEFRTLDTGMHCKGYKTLKVFGGATTGSY